MTISQAQVGTHGGHIFFLKLSTGQVMDFYWIVGSDKYFHKLLEQAKKTGAPLLGLAKSILILIMVRANEQTLKNRLKQTQLIEIYQSQLLDVTFWANLDKRLFPERSSWKIEQR